MNRSTIRELADRVDELEMINQRLRDRAAAAEKAAQTAMESARRAWQLFAASGRGTH